jgi:uncharacterized protein (TIGR03437 family)
MAVDKEGSVYVTGETVSIDFPVKGTNLTPYQGAVNYGFIAKFAPNGGSIIYSTIVGGGANMAPSKIAIDDEGNAAERGFIVNLYATGKGVTDPIGAGGQILTNVRARPRPAVKVNIGGQDATVEYAGSAPGLVAGVLQINVSVCNATSPAGVTLSVK